MAHTHTTPPLPAIVFLFLPHWLTMGRKHTQKQNEIINALYLRALGFSKKISLKRFSHQPPVGRVY